MFKHQGRSRSYKHNLLIAIFLSFVAGIVNVAGFLAIKEMITHVTGHFAFFIHDASNLQFWKGTIYLFYIFCFLSGSFTSSYIIEKFRTNKKLNVFLIPIAVEIFILSSIALISNFELEYRTEIIASSLLFAMGLQNSCVTKISDAVVRTTHLTGLFTDLGIELSQLFFCKSSIRMKWIKSKIKLRVYIIFFFFSGGLTGGFFYSEVGWELNSLFVAAAILLFSLFYDEIQFSRKSLLKKIKEY